MRWGRKMLPNASKFLCDMFLWDSTWLPSSPWSSKHLWCWCLSIFRGNCWLTNMPRSSSATKKRTRPCFFCSRNARFEKDMLLVHRNCLASNLERQFCLSTIASCERKIAWKLCTVHSPSKSCSVEDVFPCQYIKSQIILSYDVKSYYINLFCIILYYSSIYLYTYMYIYIIMWYCTLNLNYFNIL